MHNEISGKVIAITGASSGIGEAIAKALALQGAHVVLGARRESQLSKIRDEIRDLGGEATFCVTDVKNKADLLRLVDTAVTTYGRLDVIINNAGISQLSRIDELDVEGWEEMIDINLKGVLYGIAAAIPEFRKQQSGHIINIISTSGIKIVPMQGVYAGTKNAIRTIAEAFRQESDGSIRITGISPGMVKTAFADAIRNEQMRSAIQDMQGLAIRPEAIADAVIYVLGQPKAVEIGDIVIRPAAQG